MRRVAGGVCLGAVILAAGWSQVRAAEPGSIPIREVTIAGDAAVLEREGLLDAFTKSLAGQSLTPAQIQDKARGLRDALREHGYTMASVRVPPADYTAGVVPIDVDAGRFGKLTLTGPGGTAFKGRWFSEEQLRYRLSGLREGEPFNETAFYQHILGINGHPDLVVDPALSVHKEEAGGRSQRYADMACAVTESVPLHALLTVDNAGAEATGEWRASALFQYLNLTRHDDILSLWLGPVSEDDGSSQSAAASYMRPRLSGNGGATLLYGGYSDVESQEVADLFTLRGTGWFAGVREDWRTAAGPAREIVLSLGAEWRGQEEELSVDPLDADGDKKTIDVFPLSAGLRVTPLRYDGLGGRTFIEAEAVCGFGSDDDIEAFRPGAESTFVIGRGRLARLQPLARTARERAGSAWLLFARAEGQVANGALLGADQLALGGIDTVRGFKEWALMGDQGGMGSLELRSPQGRLGSAGQVQGVLFADAGHAMSEGEDDLDPVTIAAVGGGLRLALGSRSQLLADYGIPVAGEDDVEEQTGVSVDSGRIHVRATVQF